MEQNGQDQGGQAGADHAGAPFESAPPPSVTVTVESGDVTGFRSGPVDVYLGIPYAAAPFGANRFKPPKRVAPWEGSRDATAPGPTAPQLPYAGGSEKYLSTVQIAGDEILNLSVWAPNAPASAGVTHPVMVWIHGGSLAHGSNALGIYDGSSFARDGVVFVVINYRIGAEGFSVFDDAEPNLGLLDQAAALRWVRRNAAAFGGDPANVTVVGESAGAISIAALLASPDAAELFDKAIAQSGPPDAHAASKSGKVTRLMAEQLGVPASRSTFAPIPPATLLQAQKQATAGTTPITGGPAFAVTVGGNLVPRPPADAIRDGAGSEIPLLIGSNTEEYRLWFIPGRLIDTIGKVHIIAAMARFRIRPLTISTYRRNRPGASDGEVFGALATDLLLRIPINRVADARLAPGAAPTYVYEFGWRSPVDDLGACHALEIGFVFDNVDSDDAIAMAGPDAPRQLAADMHAAWVRFARDGDPGWPAWSPARPVKLWNGAGDPVVNAPREDERLPWPSV